MSTPSVNPAAVPTGLSPDAPEPLRLRPATAADAAALALVGAATFLEAYTWMLPGPDIIGFCQTQQTEAYYAKYLAEPTTRITLALTGIDAPIGYAMVCAPDMPTFDVQEGDVELKRIYIFSRFRSSGSPVLNAQGKPIPWLRGGQALMNASIESAKELGAKRLLLGTNAGNKRAIEFYVRNGFAEVGTRTFEVGSQLCTDFILAKTL